MYSSPVDPAPFSASVPNHVNGPLGPLASTFGVKYTAPCVRVGQSTAGRPLVIDASPAAPLVKTLDSPSPRQL
ncbi:hypothetical protein [Gemmatimonas sp.]